MKATHLSKLRVVTGIAALGLFGADVAHAQAPSGPITAAPSQAAPATAAKRFQRIEWRLRWRPVGRGWRRLWRAARRRRERRTAGENARAVYAAENDSAFNDGRGSGSGG